jgi:hypothetical protein
MVAPGEQFHADVIAGKVKNGGQAGFTHNQGLRAVGHGFAADDGAHSLTGRGKHDPVAGADLGCGFSDRLRYRCHDLPPREKPMDAIWDLAADW